MNDFKNLFIGAVGGLGLFATFFEFDSSLWYLLLMFIAAYPWKIGKNVYCLFGGINTEGRVYALIDIHSVAEKVVSIFSFSFFSKSTKDEIASFLGLSCFGKAESQNILLFGILFNSYGKGNLGGFLTTTIFCDSGGDIQTLIGIDFFSCPQIDFIALFFGMPIGTKTVEGNINSHFFGIPIFVNAGNSVITRICFPIFVRAKNEAILGFGIPLGQFGKNDSYISWKECNRLL